MEEDFMCMKNEYSGLEKKVEDQNKTIDQLLKQHRLSEMETLIVEQRKIIQDLVRREQRNSINDDLLICNGKIAKMEKLADGHRMIFNNFRRQQQRTNHVNSYKIEEMEKEINEHKRIVNEVSMATKKEDVSSKNDDLILQLQSNFDDLSKQLEMQQISQRNEMQQVKQQHEEKVSMLENTLEAVLKSQNEKFSKIVGAIKKLEGVSEGLKKEVAILRIENQFLKEG